MRVQVRALALGLLSLRSVVRPPGPGAPALSGRRHLSSSCTSSSSSSSPLPKEGGPETYAKQEQDQELAKPLNPAPHLTGRGFHNDTEVISHLHDTFQIPPLPRHGEDVQTLRARLLYQSRKRGILEADLLLSTFADANLHRLTRAQLVAYDKFLDENDWDIYYWCTQSTKTPPAPAPPSTSSAGSAGGARGGEEEGKEGLPVATATAAAAENVPRRVPPPQEQKEHHPTAPPPPPPPGTRVLAAGVDTGAGEWGNTVGRKKEPYRMPPEKWAHSEILAMIKKHVEERRAGGGNAAEGKKNNTPGTGRGLGRMPPMRSMDGMGKEKDKGKGAVVN